MGRDSYCEKEANEILWGMQWVTLEIQLTGRELTWCSVIKGIIERKLGFMLIRWWRILLSEHDHLLVSEDGELRVHCSRWVLIVVQWMGTWWDVTHPFRWSMIWIDQYIWYEWSVANYWSMTWFYQSQQENQRGSMLSMSVIRGANNIVISCEGGLIERETTRVSRFWRVRTCIVAAEGSVLFQDWGFLLGSSVLGGS